MTRLLLILPLLFIGCGKKEPPHCSILREEANRLYTRSVVAPGSSEGDSFWEVAASLDRRLDLIESRVRVVKKLREDGCRLPDWVESKS